MKRPSIFSSDYNKRMKKRKIMVTISIIFILMVSVISVGLIKANVNLADIKNNIQAWIDSSNIVGSEGMENQEAENIKEVAIEEPEAPKINLIELSISEGKTAKVEYEEIDGGKIIKEVNDIPKDIYYSISPSKNLILFIDEQQNMKVFNVNGDMKDLTNESYTSKNGQRFTKEWALNTYGNYTWHNGAKFIDDTKIAYLSSVPYFGENLDKYVWMVDVEGKNHTTLWNLKGKEVAFGEVTDKGLEVRMDGNKKYIDNIGNITN